jgi:hypothetical protein
LLFSCDRSKTRENEFKLPNVIVVFIVIFGVRNV